jgi:hypothetical protein
LSKQFAELAQGRAKRFVVHFSGFLAFEKPGLTDDATNDDRYSSAA